MVGKDAYHIKICAHCSHILCVNKILSCAGADSVLGSMRHLHGNPIDVAACVDIWQVFINIQVKDANKAHVIEVIWRGKFKFAGR